MALPSSTSRYSFTPLSPQPFAGDHSGQHGFTPRQAEGHDMATTFGGAVHSEATHIHTPAIENQYVRPDEGLWRDPCVSSISTKHPQSSLLMSVQQHGPVHEHVSVRTSAAPLSPIDTGSSLGGRRIPADRTRSLAAHAQASSSNRSDFAVLPNNESDERPPSKCDAVPHPESPSHCVSFPSTPLSLPPSVPWNHPTSRLITSSPPQPTSPSSDAAVLVHSNASYPPCLLSSSPSALAPISTPSPATLAPTRTLTSTHTTTISSVSYFHSLTPAPSKHMSSSSNVKHDSARLDRGGSGTILTAVSFDQARRATDTRSTSASDTRRLSLSVVMTEEDQETPEGAAAAAAGTSGQGGLSGIMGVGACHASDAAAGTAGGEGGGGRRAGERGTTELASSRRPVATSNCDSSNNHDNNSGSSSGGRYESHRYSPPPPASPSRQEYPRQHKQPQPLLHEQVHRDHQMVERHYHKTLVEGGCASSLPSSTPASSPFPPSTAGTSDPTASASASAHRLSSPSMNHLHSVPFDQAGQSAQQYSHSFHNHADNPALGNKRRSIVDLHFVPAKNIKIKEKRNSCGASSVSSVESYRQDESAMESSAGWTNQPKPTSSTSTSNPPTASSHRIPIEPQQTLPQARKPSVTKGVARGASGSTSSPKTFQCTGYPGCNMVFTRSEHLARHERKHTGEKPYKCIVTNCPRTFSRYDNMIQHTQTHGDRTRKDSLAAVAVGGVSRLRSSSVHSVPLFTGRPRTGSTSGIFGSGYDDSHSRGMQNSPASSFMPGPGFPRLSNLSHQPHSTQWTFPPGQSMTSATVMPGRSSNVSGSMQGDNQSYLPGSESGAPMVRTLKNNSRSLPQLQPRSYPRGSTESPNVGLHQSMPGMEVEELKRRKSEVLLPSSSYSGARAAAASGYSHNQEKGIGLGMSTFSPGSSHSQPLPHVEKLTPQEQERLKEHRRSAQAILFHSESMEQRSIPEHPEQAPTSGRSAGYHPNSRSGGLNGPMHQAHQPSSFEKDRSLEHRKSTPDLVYDALKAKRSSNDPIDMIVQPLPSRDARSGVQWFSQAGAPFMSSGGLPMTPRDPHGNANPSRPANSWTTFQGDRPTRPRAHSSHVHPLSRPSPQNDPSGDEYKDRLQFDPTLSPGLERHLEERYYPIRKREVLDVIYRMNARELLGLKAQVAELYANDQFRNPEFLGNMTAILCVIRAAHPCWNGSGDKRNSQDGLRTSVKDDTTGPRHPLDDIDMDPATGSPSSMDVDEQKAPACKQEFAMNGGARSMEQQCRYALDIDVDSFSRDPEPDLRSMEGLTINSMFPTKSFVAGFEPVMSNVDSNPDEEPPKSLRGYPSNARIGRFYLPERAFRTPESLRMQPDPNGAWVCCRFEEYQGVSIWVLESVLQKYHEIAQRHKMALTLVGAPVRQRMAEHNHDTWEVRAGEQYDVKIKETALYPEMIQQVWRDMHHDYYRHHFHQQQRLPHQPLHLHQQHPQHPSSRSMVVHPLSTAASSSQMTNNNVLTYEEYHKNQWKADNAQREGFHHANMQESTCPDYHHPQQRHHHAQQSYLHLQEDLSSGPSSPNSPHQEDYLQEDSQTYESASSTPQQQQHPQELSSVGGGGPGVNMHRRISIAELCNPMQSLATERDR